MASALNFKSSANVYFTGDASSTLRWHKIDASYHRTHQQTNQLYVDIFAVWRCSRRNLLFTIGGASSRVQQNPYYWSVAIVQNFGSAAHEFILPPECDKTAFGIQLGRAWLCFYIAGLGCSSCPAQLLIGIVDCLYNLLERILIHGAFLYTMYAMAYLHTVFCRSATLTSCNEACFEESLMIQMIFRINRAHRYHPHAILHSAACDIENDLVIIFNARWLGFASTGTLIQTIVTSLTVGVNELPMTKDLRGWLSGANLFVYATTRPEATSRCGQPVRYRCCTSRRFQFVYVSNQ